MINRYFQPTKYQGDFYTPPLDLLKDTLQTAQEGYNQNFVTASMIKNKYVNSLTQDRKEADSIQANWEGKINEIVSKYSGDYSQATKDLNLLLSDMEKEYQPGGKAHAIEQNYNTWTKHWAGVQEGVQKGTYTSDQAQALRKNFDKSYTGIGQKDDITGAYAQANPEPLSKFIDTNAIVQEVVAKVPKRKRKITVPIDGGDGKIFMSEQEIEYVDPRELSGAIQERLLRDDSWVSYTTQLARLEGIDPMEHLLNTVQSTVDNVTPLYSGEFSNIQGLKLEQDQAYMARLNHRLAMQRQAAKDAAADRRVLLNHALDNPEQLDQKDDLARIGTRVSANTFKPVDKSTGVELNMNPNPFNPLDPISVIEAVAKTTRSTYTTNVDTLLKNPDSAKGKVNFDLLKAAKQSALQFRDAEGKPARDPNGLTWDLYNEYLQRDHYGDAIYMRRFSNSDQMDEQSKRLLPNLVGGGVDIWEMDPNTGVVTSLKDDAKKRAEVATELWDGSKPIQPALGMTSIQTGVPFGTVFPKKDGGYYIVGEMHEDIRNLNNEVFTKAFGFINSPQHTGGIFNVDLGGKMTKAYGKKEYRVGTDRSIEPEVRYYDVSGDLIYTNILPDGTKVPLTPSELEDALFPPRYRKLFTPFKASSSDRARFRGYTEEED